MFADISARRADVEGRRSLLKSAARKSGRDHRSEHAITDDLAASRAIADADRVLSDPDVSGLDKRNLLGTIVRKVVCRKDGVNVTFLPGVFGEADSVSSVL